MKRVNPKSRRSVHFKTRKRRGSYLGITGKFPSPQNPHCLFFEGFRERDLIVLLAFDDSVERLEDHPIQIEYQDGRRTRTYKPDLLVRFHRSAGRADLLIEVKLSTELRRTGREYRARFRAAGLYCRARGMAFRVITERTLPRPLVRNLRFLLPYRWESPEPELDSRLLALASQGPKSLSSYVDSLKSEGISSGDVISAAWRLAATRKLKPDLSEPLSLNTTLEAGSWALTI
jgi:hypothetical protein